MTALHLLHAYAVCEAVVSLLGLGGFVFGYGLPRRAS